MRQAVSSSWGWVLGWDSNLLLLRGCATKGVKLVVDACGATDRARTVTRQKWEWFNPTLSHGAVRLSGVGERYQEVEAG